VLLKEIFCPKCGMLIHRCKCKNKVANNISSKLVSKEGRQETKKSKKEARKSKLKQRVIEILKKNKEMYRSEFRKYGISTGGSLTKILRELEDEGIVELVNEFNGKNYKKKVVYKGGD